MRIDKSRHNLYDNSIPGRGMISRDCVGRGHDPAGMFQLSSVSESSTVRANRRPVGGVMTPPYDFKT